MHRRPDGPRSPLPRWWTCRGATPRSTGKSLPEPVPPRARPSDAAAPGGSRPSLGTVEILIRSDGLTKSGGDTIQAEAYRDRLVALGHDVRVVPCSESWRPTADLVHYLNTDRAYEFLAAARRARRSGVPLIVSPIHH